MGTLKVFIVEDNFKQQKRLIEDVKDLGYVVIGSSRTVEGAINFLKEHPLPDVAILDIDLPDDREGGITIAKHIRRFYPSIKIIFLTDHSDIEMGNKVLSVYKNDIFLPKPFNEGAIFVALKGIEVKKPIGHVKGLINYSFGDSVFILNVDKDNPREIYIDDILMIKGDSGIPENSKRKNTQKFVKIFLRKKGEGFEEIKVGLLLKEIEEKIRHDNLLRVGKSLIINKENCIANGNKRIKIERIAKPIKITSYNNEFYDSLH